MPERSGTENTTTAPPEKKKAYEVLDQNAVFVAGARVAEDRTVELFDAQARYPLLGGQIRPAAGKAARTGKSDGPAA